MFSHFENKTASMEFCRRLNSLHPSLRFTWEGESKGKLPSLDVKVIRTDEGMVTTKPTFTGLSCSPTHYKINLVRSLTHRASRICSPTMVETESKSFCEIFIRNGYPGRVLDKYVTSIFSPRVNFIGPKARLLSAYHG